MAARNAPPLFLHETGTGPRQGAQARNNIAHSEAVDQAVLLQGTAGTVCALEYMKSRSVLPHVIERVLRHLALRRAPGEQPVMHKTWHNENTG